MVRQLYPAGDAEIFMSHIMRVFDTDGNNYLDFKEFLMAMDISNCQTSEPLHPITAPQQPLTCCTLHCS